MKERHRSSGSEFSTTETRFNTKYDQKTAQRPTSLMPVYISKIAGKINNK